MFVNWYATDMWVLWSRSPQPDMIPVLKTTSAHWRKLKQDHLHRFGRPRIDLVVGILTTRLVPDILRTTQAILRKDYRIARASWRKDFQKEWLKAAEHAKRLDDGFPTS